MTDRAMIEVFNKRYPTAMMAIDSDEFPPKSKAASKTLLDGFSQGWEDCLAHARHEIIEQIKADADKYSNAINDAAWEFNNAYVDVMGEVIPGRLFNAAKTILKRCIIKYLEALSQPTKG